MSLLTGREGMIRIKMGPRTCFNPSDAQRQSRTKNECLAGMLAMLDEQTAAAIIIMLALETAAAAAVFRFDENA